MGGVGKVHDLPAKFSRNESENLASLIICKFIPLIQCGASTRDLLHSAMFLLLEQLAIKFCGFYALNLTKNIILIYVKLSSTTQIQTTIEEKKNDKSLKITIKLKNFNMRPLQ